MFKHLLLAALTLIPALANAGAQLTEMEMRWLKAAITRTPSPPSPSCCAGCRPAATAISRW